jgi:hypothetical protein
MYPILRVATPEKDGIAEYVGTDFCELIITQPIR